MHHCRWPARRQGHTASASIAPHKRAKFVRKPLPRWLKAMFTMTITREAPNYRGPVKPASCRRLNHRQRFLALSERQLADYCARARKIAMRVQDRRYLTGCCHLRHYGNLTAHRQRSPLCDPLATHLFNDAVMKRPMPANMRPSRFLKSSVKMMTKKRNAAAGAGQTIRPRLAA